jgi:hypothetical protein
LTASAGLERLLALAQAVLTGRAGLFARVTLACLAFVLVAEVLRRRLSPQARAWGQIGASVVLLAVLTTPLLAALMVVYALAFYAVVEHLPPGRLRAGVVVGMVALQVLGPIFWFPRLPGYAPPVRALVAFATNMTQLRSWAYAYDRLRRRDPPQASLRDYALYTFFFPAFVNGPLASPADFQRRLNPRYWDPSGTLDRQAVRNAVQRILVGMAAVVGALWVGSALGEDAYRAAAGRGAGLAWAHSIGVYAAFYLGFTAWTEVAIGFGLLAGVRLPENFDRAHLAYGPAEFWRRWNITLGHWMRDYVYLPLGGAHPGGRRDRVAWWNVAAVFGVVAAYHHVGGLKLLGTGLAASPMFYLGWTLWAVYNTLGTLATRTLRRPTRWRLRHAALVGGTFLFASACWTTALFPPHLGLPHLLAIYRRLLLLG